jgi:hypothetical protein
MLGVSIAHNKRGLASASEQMAKREIFAVRLGLR